jgi:hypothetical protein
VYLPYYPYYPVDDNVDGLNLPLDGKNWSRMTLLRCLYIRLFAALVLRHEPAPELLRTTLTYVIDIPIIQKIERRYKH